VLLLREQQAQAAQQRIGLLVGGITENAQRRELQGWPEALIRDELTTVADYYDIRILVLDRSSRVVIDTARGQSMLGMVIPIDQARPADASGRVASFRTQRISVEGEDLYLFTASEGSGMSATSAALRGAPPPRPIVIAVPAGDVTDAWAALLPRLALAGAGAGVVAVVFALLFASRITNPIAEMTRASRAMAAGDLSQRIDVDGDDEVARLAAAFNLMSSRVSRSNRAMRDLLADVSHELRTPLTSIQGFSQALVDGVADDPRSAGALINEEASRIRLLVDDLLYLSEIESGTLHLDLEPVDIDAVLDGTVRRLAFAAAEGEVDVVTRLEAGDRITADGRRLEQVFANLLDNAIRYAPPRTTVTLSSRGVADGVLVEVHNWGAPIPADALPRVFDRFYQADPSRSRGSGHRGLGLAIVQELVQAHGGNIAVESDTARGTTFSVFLRTEPPSAAAAREASRAEER
jgi:signal transduction histidine kinase